VVRLSRAGVVDIATMTEALPPEWWVSEATAARAERSRSAGTHTLLALEQHTVCSRVRSQAPPPPPLLWQLVPSPEHTYGYRNPGLAEIYLRFGELVSVIIIAIM
jgi:hypothetical protein